jgi:hypothetical protein
MLTLLLIALSLTTLVIMSARIKQLPKNLQNRAWWKFASILLACLLIILVITGRMHWIGALLGALLPFLRGAFSFMTQLLPFWFKHKGTILSSEENMQKANHDNTSDGDAMSIQAALQLLGLTQAPQSVGDIYKAHSDILQALDATQPHAAQLIIKINCARDTLLKSLMA